MQLVRRLRIPALFCAFAMLVCELIAHPYTTTGICDDGPYILMAHTLATTGHIVYNGWGAPMLGWQLYLGAAFIKLFGFSFSAVRMSTLFVAVALAFLLQRTLVAANITERNATLATLAFVLSPLYLMLSVTFMTDITSLFAIVICLYGCLRALQASTGRSTLAWLCFAVAANAIFGTSRQIAWLGILVMVPSTLWLLRNRRRVLLAGTIANLAGIAFIFICLHWLKQQPYSIPEHILPPSFSVVHGIEQLGLLLLDIPFLLLPVAALFLREIRKSSSRVIAILSVSFLCYLFLATYPSHLHGAFSSMLEPSSGGPGSWIGVHGTVEILKIHGEAPLFLHPVAQVLLTLVSFGSLIGLIISLLRSRRASQKAKSSRDVSWQQLGILFSPFTLAYTLLLLPRAATNFVFDRYLLVLLVIALICLIRYYQERTQAQLPLAILLLVAIMAIYGIAVTHNMFELYRARVALADELSAAGVPATSVDNGWDYNLDVELQHASHLNFPGVVIPPDAYNPTPPLPAGTCSMQWYDYTPHIHPIYGVSFDPTACYGPAPFAPVHYSRWLASSPGTLYVVNYTASSKH